MFGNYYYCPIVMALVIRDRCVWQLLLLDNSYSSFRTLLLYICGASAAAIYFHATEALLPFGAVASFGGDV
ncbi:MAG: hypothetical protein SWX82_14620 [Cyanobacteriota bacterium]|nr:hypothetical protein [Cyanobacteriota bacterium]